MRTIYRHIMVLFFLSAVVPALAQTMGRVLEKQGDSLRMQYDFKAAEQKYQKAMSMSEDSVYNVHLMEKMTQCDNGFGMLQYATKPEVWQTLTVSRSEFFLYYSHLGDGHWKRTSDGNIVYFDETADMFIYSDEDENGKSNLYVSNKINDTLWGEPMFLNEGLVSDKDDILPMLSPDGKSLYFSSQGLFGMGGFDLFVSKWDEDEKDWSMPENLGFPFSSPYDDYLFSPTSDGNFALFASNRDCSGDSVTIYVTKFDSTPVKEAVSSIAEAREIAKLSINSSLQDESADMVAIDHPVVKDSLSLRYIELYGRHSKIKEDIKILQRQQENTRALYAVEQSASGVKKLESVLIENEANLFKLQAQLGVLSEDLQKTEMECLMNGIVPDVDIINAQASKDKTTNESPVYEFKKTTLTSFPGNVLFKEPEEKIDYSFKISNQAMVVEDNTLPSGLVYQIQIFVSGNKATLKQLKGLSPVFEKKAPSGNYVYTVGLFSKYNDALSNINAVKKLGFTSAYIVAFDSGKGISIKNARTMESSRGSGEKYRVVFTQYTNGLPIAISTLLRSLTAKDLAKGVSDKYGTIYFVAPFNSRIEAEQIAEKIIAGGAEGVIVEAIR